MIKLAPSILNADLVNLEREVKKIASADWIHFDVMDGHFVPNLTFGPMFVSAIRKVSDLPIESHLMVDNPEFFIPLYAKEGCKRIIIQVETGCHLHRLIQHIKEYGCEAGVALNPATPLNCLEYILPDLDSVLIMTVNPGYGGQKLIDNVIPKIKQLKNDILARGLKCQIEVDGGVNWENIKTLIGAGVDIIVAGTLIFCDPNPDEVIVKLKNTINSR